MYSDKKSRIPDETFDAAASLAAQEKPTYAGTFEDQLKGIYDKIANREPFQYDVNADPLYQQYKDQYIQGGKLAMKDTMGQAAALTGGYGSTYGQQVGQQAYDAYLQQLGAVIPELYGMAYSKYRDEGDDLKDLYGLAGDLRDKEYARYRDELGDYRYEDELAYARGRDDLADRRYEDELVYSRGRDALADQRYNEERDYSRSRDTIADQRYADELAYARGRDAIADERYADERDYNRRKYEDETAYSRSRDTIADQRYDDQLAYSRGRDAISDQRYADELAYNRAMSERDSSYNRQQQAYSSLYSIIKASGYAPTDEELAAAGMTRAAADALRNEYLRANGLLPAAEETPAAGGIGGGIVGSGGNGGAGGKGGAEGNDGGNGNGDDLTVDMGSIIELGYGPISATKLSELVESGAVNEQVIGNKIVYTNNTQKKTENAGAASAIRERSRSFLSK